MPTWRRSGFWTTSLRRPRPRRARAAPLRAAVERAAAERRDASATSELGGLIVQRGASTVHTDVDADDRPGRDRPLEQAVEEHPELVQRVLRQAPRPRRGQVPAAHARRSGPAACSSTCPKDVKVEKPIQIVYADRRARHRAVRAHAGRGRRARRVRRSASTASAPTSRARRCTPAPSSSSRGPGAQVEAGPLPGLGPRRGLRHLHQAGRDRAATRIVQLGADPPRRPADQADARHHHRRAGLGHAPHGHVLHRGRRAPRPVHHRPARGRPHHRRHRLEGRADRRVARVVRGPDPHRPRARRRRTPTCRPTRCCSRRRRRATRSRR